jgi:hypothetical protein
VRKQVLGLDRHVCMISDRHHGLFNGAKDNLEGYPPLIHRWSSRYFATNIWKKQLSKEVITRLKALCKVKEQKKFEDRLKELENILNDNGKTWLFEQLSEKSMWALVFDEGDSQYLTESFWDNKHRAHLLTEEGAVSVDDWFYIFY